jgi:multidrug transporter EmrE-like cation transporter
MNYPLFIIIAILCNVGAQVAIKYAANTVSVTTLNSWSLWLSPWLITAVALYGLSFLLTVRVFATNPLSIAAPVMAGSVFILLALASYIFFNENITLYKILGMALIILGIILLCRQ